MTVCPAFNTDTSCVIAGLLPRRQGTTVLARAAMTGLGWTLPGARTLLGVTGVPTVATALGVRSPSVPAVTKAHDMTGLLTALLLVIRGFVYPNLRDGGV